MCAVFPELHVENRGVLAGIDFFLRGRVFSSSEYKRKCRVMAALTWEQESSAVASCKDDRRAIQRKPCLALFRFNT